MKLSNYFVFPEIKVAFLIVHKCMAFSMRKKKTSKFRRIKQECFSMNERKMNLNCIAALLFHWFGLQQNKEYLSSETWKEYF